MRKISQEHTTEFLKALSNDIYHSVSDELTDTVNISKTVANDSLLIDLLEKEDASTQNKTENKIAAYTTRLKKKFSYSWVFIVSDQSKAYYSDNGIYRIIDPVNEEEDAWYADFVGMDKEYDVSIGRDSDVPDSWTVFVDTRIENENGEFLGVCGVALELNNLQESILNYENEYGIEVFFVDQNGMPQLESGSIQDALEQKQILPEQTKDEQIVIEKSGMNTNYTIFKYIEQLGWYMVIKDVNPYNYTVDYNLIGLNVSVFFVFLIITAMSLRFIAKREGSLLVDSYQDNLTRLLNQRAFDESMRRLREQDSLENLIIAVFDLNGLKQINDSLGHLAGDELITGGARLIQEVFGPYGKCYRIGGDEFVAILDKPEKNIAALTEQFEKALSEWRGEQVETLSISYGIACAVDENSTIDEMFFLADEQMYRKKKAYYHKRKHC
jgi:diguanylate cyclase (GGDEF)-like protein